MELDQVLLTKDTLSCVSWAGAVSRSCRDLIRGFATVYSSSFRLCSMAVVRTEEAAGRQAIGRQQYRLERHREIAFPGDGQAERAAREFSVAPRGHGVFVCRGDRFNRRDATEKPMRQRSSEPHSRMPKQRRTLGSLGYCQFQPESDRLPRRRQLSGLWRVR